MSNSPEFGHAPICPEGFTPDYKVDAMNEERRHYRQLWLDEKGRVDALKAHIKAMQKLADEAYASFAACHDSECAQALTKLVNIKQGDES